MAAAPSGTRRQRGRREVTGGSGHGDLGHRRVQGGRAAGQREQAVAGVDRAAGGEPARQRHHPVGRVGGQQRHHRQPEQPVGGRPPAATAPQPHQHGQEQHVGQGQDDRVQLLVQRQRRVAGVGEHQELPGHHAQPGRDDQRVQQRRQVAAAAAGPDQPQQGDREQHVGGQKAQVGQVLGPAGPLDGVAGAQRQQGGRDQVPGPGVGRAVAPGPGHDGDRRAVGERGRAGRGDRRAVGEQEVADGRGRPASHEPLPGQDPHTLLSRQVRPATVPQPGIRLEVAPQVTLPVDGHRHERPPGPPTGRSRGRPARSRPPRRPPRR